MNFILLCLLLTQGEGGVLTLLYHSWFYANLMLNRCLCCRNYSSLTVFCVEENVNYYPAYQKWKHVQWTSVPKWNVAYTRRSTPFSASMRTPLELCCVMAKLGPFDSSSKPSELSANEDRLHARFWIGDVSWRSIGGFFDSGLQLLFFLSALLKFCIVLIVTFSG